MSYGATSGGFQSYQGRRPTSSTPFTHGPPAGSRPGGYLASKGTSSFRGGGGRLGGRGLGHTGHRAPPRPPFASSHRERAALQYDDASPAGGDFGNGQDAHVNETIPEPGSGERSYDDSYDIGEDEQAEYTQDDFLHSLPPEQLLALADAAYDVARNNSAYHGNAHDYEPDDDEDGHGWMMTEADVLDDVREEP